MKKLFILLILILLTVFVKAQTFPITQNLGSPTTLIRVKGGIKADSGFVNAIFLDTTVANINPYIKNYVGAAIFTTSDNTVWVRNAAATAWVAQAGATNITINNIYNNSITNVSIINQIDTTITFEICTGAGACDTLVAVTNVTYKVGAQVSLIDSSHVEICGTDSLTLVQSCDTLSIPPQILYSFSNGIGTNGAGNVQLGYPLLHPTTIDQNTFPFTLKNGVFQYQDQSLSYGLGKVLYDKDGLGDLGYVQLPGSPLTDGWVVAPVLTWDSARVVDYSYGIFNLGGVQYSFPAGHMELDTLIGTDPRQDAIVGDTTAKLTFITGTPSADPAVPVPPDNELYLTSVLINAGDNQPANLKQQVIYDENLGTAGGEYAATVSGATADFNNTTAPAHLTKAGNITNIATNRYLLFTNNTTDNLSNYTSFKFYIRLKATLANKVRITFQWLNGNTVINTNVVQIGGTNSLYGFSRTLVNTYQTISIPTSAFARTTDQFTALKIIFTNSSSSGFYIDWIQLQGFSNSGGGGGSGGTGTVTTFSATGNIVITPTVTNPTTTPNLALSLANAAAYTVLANSTNTSAPPTYTQVNLGTAMVTGLLPVTNLAVAPANYYLGSLDGITNQWLPLASLYDSAYVKNWLRTKNGAVRDTIVFGSPYQDSALLSYDTYVGLNTHAFHIQQGATDFLLIDPINYISDILQNDGTSESAIEIDANTSSGTVRANLYAYNGTNQASILADANSNIISLDVSPPGGPDLAKITLSGNDSTVSIFGALVISAFTPANSTDSTYPIQTLTSDDTYIYYRKSNGTWVKIAWTAF